MPPLTGLTPLASTAFSIREIREIRGNKIFPETRDSDGLQDSGWFTSGSLDQCQLSW